MHFSFALFHPHILTPHSNPRPVATVGTSNRGLQPDSVRLTPGCSVRPGICVLAPIGSCPSPHPHKAILDLETLGTSATTGTLELPTLGGNVRLLLDE